jgi:hypothetical protein
METTTRIRTRGNALVALAAAAFALATAAPAAAQYGWPVKPFHRQHPVRAYFGDPRIGNDHGYVAHTLHFGIDIYAPNGTPVYATISGRISIHPLHSDTVLVQSGGMTLEYWHVVPAVRSGYAVAYRTIIGHVEKPWAHVHFSERYGSTYVNPLRAGALTPYRDTTKPTVDSIRIAHGDVVANAHDTTPLAVPAPWNDKPVAPALVEWRLLGSDVSARGWRVTADFRDALPRVAFSSVYAPDTTQNHASTVGVYTYVLAQGWSPAALPAGRYVLQVRIVDTAGNAAVRSLRFIVRGKVARPSHT